MTTNTKVWIYRAFLLALSFFLVLLFVGGDTAGAGSMAAIPMAVTLAGFIYSFYKNPFDK